MAVPSAYAEPRGIGSRAQTATGAGASNRAQRGDAPSLAAALHGAAIAALPLRGTASDAQRITGLAPERIPRISRPPSMGDQVRSLAAGRAEEGSAARRDRAPRPGTAAAVRPHALVTRPMVSWRLIACVLLPFAAGYYLSYVLRTINALIAGDLAADLGLSAADLGFVTSVYFLVCAAVQLPLGALLDRYGPRTIDSVLLLFASAGALIFALADNLLVLLLGRALIGLGVSLALMAGLKAIVLWFPPHRVAIANGSIVMLGALGAVTATGPAEAVVQAIGWRGLFALLAGLTAAAALLVLIAVPDAGGNGREAPATRTRVWDIYRDQRFWRIAPLSSLGIGTAWSLQGLWAAPWLRDVAGLDRPSIVRHLGAMAIALSASALLLGAAADRLRRRGITTEALLAVTFFLSIAAQAALLLGWPIPSYLLWCVIAAAGAATVLSFAILSSYFPKDMSARANAALNLLHIGSAFLLQSATGFIIALWPEVRGGYPPEAHYAAMATLLLLEIAAFAWFAAPRRLPASVKAARNAIGASLAVSLDYAPRMRYVARLAPPAGWRFAAAASLLLCFALSAALSIAISQPAVAVHVVETRSPHFAGGGAPDAAAPAQMPAVTVPPSDWRTKHPPVAERPGGHQEAARPPAVARPLSRPLSRPLAQPLARPLARPLASPLPARNAAMGGER
jgi:predicted MFS family arabinose efflux permease